MIEIEFKLQVTSEEKEKLLAGAIFVSRKTNVDAYYDSPDFSLVAQDIWLRERNGCFELKLPREGNDNESTSYQEIEDEQEIKKYFSIPGEENLVSGLTRIGYAKFAIFHTERESYEREGIVLDFDTTIFDDDTSNPFVMVEAEVMAADDADIVKEKESLKAKVTSFGVELKSGGGKGGEYFCRYHPEIFKTVFKHQ